MSLLVIHPPTIDPTPFIRSLTGSSGVWHIDNKYYSAPVDVVLKPANELEERVDAEAVVYLYDDDPTPPTRLTSFLAAAAPELAFAVRLPMAGSPAVTDGKETHDPEQEEDVWDAVGLEYVDLSSSTTHDARLLGVRESLQTIMWAGMVRKPLSKPNQRTGAEPAAPSSTNRSASIAQARTPFGLLPAEEDAFLQREQATLDAWLDDDDDGVAFPAPPRDAGGFEDDFAPSRTGDEAFGAFQSGTALLPSGPSSQRAKDDDDDDDDPLFPTDTTHLFAHLQALRDELSGVPDDVRRTRAAREVERLFAGLGLDSLDLDLEEEPVPGNGV